MRLLVTSLVAYNHVICVTLSCAWRWQAQQANSRPDNLIWQVFEASAALSHRQWLAICSILIKPK
jgi:hypothetical protein